VDVRAGRYVPSRRPGLVPSLVVSTFTGEEVAHASIVLPCVTTITLALLAGLIVAHAPNE